MGRGSATRNVAAVTIQRWLRRRFELTRAMRLLGILHILREEASGSNIVAPLLCSRETTTFLTAMEIQIADSSNEEMNVPERIVDLLTDVAVMYAKRLHAANHTRDVNFVDYDIHLGNVGTKSKQTEETCGVVRRVLLLPDSILTELLKEIRVARPQRHYGTIQHLQMSFGISGVIWLLQFLSESNPTEETKKTRTLWWCLWRVLSNAHVALNDNAFHTVDNVPSLPQPSFVRLVDLLEAEENKREREEREEEERERNETVSDRDKNESVALCEHSSSDSDAEDAYDDDKYYRRQRERERARVARMKSMLQIRDTSTGEGGDEISRDSVACESHMQLFGEVKDVLFPTLNAMRLITFASTNIPTSSSAVVVAPLLSPSMEDGGSRCCLVCELGGELSEFVVCRCGSTLHAECAIDVVNGVPYCSQFCSSL